jgi:hypothetical protein
MRALFGSRSGFGGELPNRGEEKAVPKNQTLCRGRDRIERYRRRYRGRREGLEIFREAGLRCRCGR